MSSNFLKQDLRCFLKENYLFLILIYAIYLFKLDQFFYTIFWDEPTYANPILTQGFDIFFPTNDKIYSYTPHIMGYSLLLFFAKSVLGGGLLSLRLLSFFNFLLLLVVFYKTLNKHTNDRYLVNLMILAFFLIPINIPFSTMIQPDLFVLNAGVWIFYFYSQKNYKAFWVTAFLSSFLFETVIAFIAPLLVLELVKLKKKEINIKRLLISISTVTPLLGYLVFRKLQKGLFLFHNTILEKESQGSFDWLQVTTFKMRVLNQLIFALIDNVGIFLIILIPSLFIIKYKDKFKAALYTLWIALAFILFWFFFGEFHARNLISVYGFVALMCFISICHLNKIQAYVLILLSLIVLGVKNQNPKNSPDSYYITYRDGHDVLLKTLTFIYSLDNRNITTFWPIRVNIQEHADIHNFAHSHTVMSMYQRLEPSDDIVMINLERDHDESIALRNFLKKHPYKEVFSYSQGKYKAQYFVPKEDVQISKP
jgi:hypothetical protein